mgnify:FL=1
MVSKIQLVVVFIILHFTIRASFAQNHQRLDSLNYLYETAANDSLKVWHLVSISREYANNNIPLSLEYAQKAVEWAKKTDNKNVIAYSIYNLAVSYFIQGLLEYSIKCFYEYLEIQKEAGDEKGMAYAWANLGGVLLQLEQFKEAEENLGKSLEIFEKLAARQNADKVVAELVSIYNNLGIALKSLNQPDKAIDYYLRGISLAKHIPGQEANLANLYNNLGELYLNKGNTPGAFENLEKALQIRLKIDDKFGLINSYRMMATYFDRQNDKKRALDLLYKGYYLAKKIGSLSQQATFMDRLFKHYYEEKMADSALKFKILFTDTEEVLNAEVSKKEIAMLELTSQMKENEKIRLLEQKRKEGRYLIIGLVLMLLMSMLAFLYFLSQSRLRSLRLEKENIALVSKNLELEKSNLVQELEVKNKELTTNVMYQIQKNELIREIGQKLNNLSYSISKSDQKFIIDIIKDLEKTQDSNIWSEFELRFQQVHNDFYNRLNELNPDLSPNDRRLCAFLRLNMTTKEICSITGQSIRSIEVARTRLRKKLDLTNSETGLIEYLSKL